MKLINGIKALFLWAIKNSWNLFSVIGVFATLYLGLFYVPDYVKDSTAGKINVIHESLISDIQEILFNEKILTLDDVRSFILGKELKQGVTYPYNPVELLLQVQERFISNKFIPLDKRELLLHNITQICQSYKPPLKPVKKAYDWASLASWFFSGIGLGFAVIGIASIVRKNKLDKETEVDVSSSEDFVKNQHNNTILAAIEFEAMVGEVLKELGVFQPFDASGQDRGIDFLAQRGNKEFIVEVKKFRKLLGLGTAREFMYQVNKSKRGGILVVSSGVTQRTLELIEEHNKVSENQKVYLVVGDSKDSIKQQLEKIFSTKLLKNC